MKTLIYKGATYFLSSTKGCGESGIRTHVTLLTQTRFPSVRLQPLGHLSKVLNRELYYSSSDESASMLSDSGDFETTFSLSPDSPVEETSSEAKDTWS